MKDWATKHQFAVRKVVAGTRGRPEGGVSRLKQEVDFAFKGWLQRRGYTDTTLGDMISAECAERMGEAQR